MQPNSSLVVDPELSTLVEQTRNRYGRAGLLTLVELSRRELIQPDPWSRGSLVGP